MFRRPPDRSRTIAIVLLLGFLGAACAAEAPKRGVRVVSIDSDVGLGIELDENAVLPANTILPPEAFTAPPPPEFNLSPPPVGTGGGEPTLADICPTAPDTETPDLIAPTAISFMNRPPEGTYRWKFSASRTVGGQTQMLEAMEASPRRIFDVRTDATLQTEIRAFLFKMSQQELLTNATVTTWYRVVTDGAGDRQGLERDELEGIYITRIDRTDTRGTTTNFVPQPAVQIVQFPMDVGKVVGSDDPPPPSVPPSTPSSNAPSTGYDPNLNQRLTVRTTVQGNEHLDACGEELDSWRLEGWQEYQTNQGTLRIGWKFNVATQFGGMMAREEFAVPFTNPQQRYEAQIGQVRPDGAP